MGGGVYITAKRKQEPGNGGVAVSALCKGELIYLEQGNNSSPTKKKSGQETGGS